MAEDNVADLERRLAEVREQKQELTEARRGGSLNRSTDPETEQRLARYRERAEQLANQEQALLRRLDEARDA